MKFRTVKKIRTAASFAVICAVCCGIISSPQTNYSVKAYTSSTVADLENKKQELLDRNNEIDKEIASLDSSIAASEEMQDLYWDKLQTQKETVDTFNNLIYYKNEEITDKKAEIEKKDQQISAKEEEIAKKEKDIENLQAENEANLLQFGEIMHAMYVTGGVDIFSVLAEATDFYDILVRAKMMWNISEQNTRFMDGLKQSIKNAEDMIAQLEQDVQELNRQREQLLTEKQELEDAKAELEGLRGDAQALSDEYNNNYYYYAGQISNYEDKQEKLEQEKKANAKEVEEYEKQIQEEIRKAQQGSSQVYQDGEWWYPLDSKHNVVTTYFGYDDWRSGNHSGVDLWSGSINGANIYASKSGTVITAKTDYIPGYSYGKYVVIDHGNGYSTLYGHCSAIYVTVGQQVNQGDVIAAVGTTGWSTGPHLHFEVRINGIAQNPFNYITRP